MRLATTIGDFQGYCETQAQMVRAYEDTGFKHLDYSFYRLNYEGSPFMTDDWVKNIAEASREAERLGFDFVQAHSPSNDYFSCDRETVIKGTIRSIEACAYLGIDRIVVHSGRSRKFKMPEDWKTYLTEIKGFYEALYPAMEKYNVRVLAENYLPADNGECSLASGGDMVELADMCGHPLLGVCWDVGHANLINPDQYGDIVKLGERLGAVHIQDNMGIRDDHICPYMGTLDIDAVMRGLKDNGFIDRNGVFTFESDNIVSFAGSWPNYRNKSGEQTAADPTLEVKRAAVRLMYEIGKAILTKYGLKCE